MHIVWLTSDVIAFLNSLGGLWALEWTGYIFWQSKALIKHTNNINIHTYLLKDNRNIYSAVKF